MPPLEKPIYRFGEFELDPGERRLLAHGKPVTLTPKVFDTLVLLVEHAGHVLSKDELMAALWPRGFVEESNLTKHIWLIRKALDDTGSRARFIETVPKRGYRFVAPIERCAEPRRDVGLPATPILPASTQTSVESASAAGAEPPQDPRTTANDAARGNGFLRRRHRIVAAAIALLAAVGIAIAVSVRRTSEPPATPPDIAGASIAVVNFNNLSRNAKDAWLDPAFTEMMANELTVGGTLYALPDELVRPAHGDIEAPLAGGYSRQSLQRLQKRLGADYVLSGSYLVSGANDRAEVRLDLSLQRPRDGATVATLSRSAPLADLLSLVTGAGAALRGTLGIVPANPAELRALANVQPPNSEVARRIGFALDALRKNDPARARDELLAAVALAPGYAPAYAYLAQAWATLGYATKASAAAEQAAAYANDLPEEQRLQIETQRYATQHDWPNAAQRALALVNLRPDDASYRLRLIQLLLAGSKTAEAKAALDALSQQPFAADDPRVALAGADIAATQDDAKVAADQARRALALATQRDEPGQIAEAKTKLGSALFHLGEQDAAQTILREAIAEYQRSGNPHGEALARDVLGKSLSAASRGDAAREEYQRAMSIYQGIGDLGGVATTYTDLSRMLWIAGDRDGAETAARHVRDISRETGDLHLLAWSLQALAIAATDEAISDEVISEFREVISLDEKTNNEGGLVWSLANLADTLRLRGDLDEAQATCGRADGLVGQLSDPQFAIVETFICGNVALDRGDVAAALERFKQSGEQAQRTEDGLAGGNVDLMLGQVDLGRGEYAAASDHLERAARAFATAEASSGEADAAALLALCRDALGDVAGRDREAARARALRGRITERQEVFAVDLSLATLRARAGDAQAIGELRALGEDADRRHWLGWSLESRLALVGALEHRRDADAARQRAQLAAAASAHGYGWITARLGNKSASALALRR